MVTFERRAKKPTDLPPELPFVGMEHVEPDTGIVDIAKCPPVSCVTSQVYLYSQNHVLYGKLPDLKQIPTGEGWLYLGVVLDVWSRSVVGWAMRPNAGAELVVDALEMALWRRKPAPGLVHRSDRGAQSDYLHSPRK